jgi:hypothetical protein
VGGQRPTDGPGLAFGGLSGFVMRARAAGNLAIQSDDAAWAKTQVNRGAAYPANHVMPLPDDPGERVTAAKAAEWPADANSGETLTVHTYRFAQMRIFPLPWHPPGRCPPRP